MSITIVVVTKNMCISRHWKFELVAYRIHVQTQARFTLLMFLNLIIHLYVQSVQKMFSIFS
jgi:hypothetical protein